MKERENKEKESKGGTRKERKVQILCLFIASVVTNRANASEDTGSYEYYPIYASPKYMSKKF
jgi:hypothetical protein